MQLMLEAKEQEILALVLTSAISDLGHEIAYTENYEFRQHLKERKRILQEILSRLKEGNQDQKKKGEAY